MTPFDVLDATEVSGLAPLEAVRAIESALRAGLDPADTPARRSVGTGAGELLLMPATTVDGLGVKLVTVAPGNPARGLPRIHGVYVLFDPQTLAPTAVLEAAALTTVRTPAVSLAAVRSRIRARRPLKVVVFGAGPQGVGHLRTLQAVLEDAPDAQTGAGPDVTPLIEATVVVRNPAHARLHAMERTVSRLVGATTPAVTRALADADMVVCATTSKEPLFPAEAVGDTVVVIAVGAHEPSALEVPPELAAGAAVVVEDPATARREAGVVRAAIGGGLMAPEGLLSLQDVVRGAASLPTDRPVLFVSVGMAWEDLVVARAVHRAHSGLKTAE